MKYFTRNNRETILKNPWYKIHRDQITTNQSSKNLTYYVVDFEEESVGAVIMNDHHEILFVQAIRYITNELSLEIPAGGVEKGEDIFTAAKRECQEETGYSVSLSNESFSFYPSNGFSNQKYNVVFGKVRENDRSQYDKDEVAEIQWIPANQALKKIKSGEITDGPTITAVLLFMQAELCK